MTDEMTGKEQSESSQDEVPAKTLQRQFLETELIDHISRNQQVFYKSQQINDPELNAVERIEILKQVLEKSHTIFLSRFGLFIKEEHLNFFEQEQQTSGYSPDERYEVDYYLEKIRKARNGGREQEARNRRYAALQKMVNEGNYFSETEMMQREPLLYDQLVGQYLTEKEKKARDAAVTKNDSLVTILFNGMDRENTDLLRKEQECEEQQMEEAVSDDEEGHKEKRPDSPGFSQAQWGNFDLEEEERQKSRQQEREAKIRNKKISVPMSMLTAGERDLLRDEFIGTMYSKFISGEDEEFDYSKVDESIEYDDLDIIEQDEQEKYFDKDDTEDSGACIRREGDSEMQQDDSEEDDLDVYMRHLTQHLENQKNLGQPRIPMREINYEYSEDDDEEDDDD